MASDPPSLSRRMRRRERLLGYLPSIYRSQDPDGAVFRLLDTLAGRLAEMDEALAQVLAGRWVQTAAGEPLLDGLPAPLDLIGRLCDVPRLEAESGEAAAGPPDPKEAARLLAVYRRRLLLTVATLSRGATTPRAVLSLAMAVLEAELQPQLPVRGNVFSGTGLPLGRASGSVKADDLIKVDLIENPLELRRVVIERLTASESLLFRHHSVVGDRPVVRLTALEREVVFPSLQNTRTGEVILYAGKLAPGETLTIWPELDELEKIDYAELERGDPHRQFGAAVDGISRNELIFYLGGTARFSDGLSIEDEAAARFGFSSDPKDLKNADAAVFSASANRVRSPLLQPGDNRFIYRGYGAADVSEVRVPTVGADGQTEYVQPAALRAAPPVPVSAPIKLELSAWLRPPATFRLDVTRNAGFLRVDPRAAALLHSVIERVRGAGVRVSVDFVEPARTVEHDLGEGPLVFRVRADLTEDAAPAEPALEVRVAESFGEAHALREGALLLGGVFDVTAFDRSLYFEP